MDGFKEGYEFFEKHTGNFAGHATGIHYVNAVESEIKKLVNNLNDFETSGARIDTLKGDVAEFWHAGTFNINAAINSSKNRVQVDRSHDFGSADITGVNFDAKFGLKYYKDGTASAIQQSKSILNRFNEYKTRGRNDNLELYLEERGLSAETDLNSPVYSGQYRVIPSDQLKEATMFLERKIREEAVKRPEQVHRYEETLKLLRDKVKDNEGNESIALSEQEARELASLSKEGGVNPEGLHLTTEELIKFTNILRQAYKAGLTAATISMVLRVAPEVLNAIAYLIKNGEIEEGQFKKIGFAAITGAGEGFVRGTVSAAITASCKAGLCGSAMKSIDPSIVGAVTVLVMNSMKNSYQVTTGNMSRAEMVNELIKEMFVTTCALSMGAASQSLIEIPVLGYMIGSFVGSIAGSVIYSSIYNPVLSFCVDSGFTLFGLVDQDYELPEEVLKEIGIEIFEYEKFEYEPFEYEKFEYEKFEYEQFEYEKLHTIFLRRGVIGVNCIGYM
ncbi:hypothetical protein [Streptococcus infantis]|uniref:hypothetical protein n=1 Tax=Streptococcus infantis TaxID=68892 RepID=UPI00248161D4|nr:hypothetical protein [Streptococcus infantis]MDH9149587.1 hypothetical protein [Streptococcus infantis]